ncbi:MAG: tripartite tricarboxylate transporter substrate binding protein [Pseudomonadota bacterium]
MRTPLESATRRALAAAVAALALPGGAAHAQAPASASAALPAGWPARPLHLVVPFAPGGGADIVARAIAVPLGRRLGQPVVLDNKPGGGGTLGADLVAKAPADGYTLLYTTPGPQLTNPWLMPRLPYDPATDLLPVSGVIRGASVLVVNKNVPARNVKELIAYARAHPGRLNFGSAGVGSSSHLAGELFKHDAGIDIVHVSYRGSGPLLLDLLSGNVGLAIDATAVYLPHIQSGALRAIAVANREPVSVLPGVRPIADDLPGFEGSPVTYISVRGGTPPALVERLNREVNAVLAEPDTARFLQGNGLLPLGNTPEQMAALVKSESAKWRDVIRSSGARVD